MDTHIYPLDMHNPPRGKIKTMDSPIILRPEILELHRVKNYNLDFKIAYYLKIIARNMWFKSIWVCATDLTQNMVLK